MTSASARTFLRRSNGTFVSHGVQTETQLKTSTRRVNYGVRKELIRKHIFDEFAGLFFLPGSSEDWVPVSRNSGPLVVLFELLFKQTYILNQAERSEKLALCFTAQYDEKHCRMTKRIFARDANLQIGDRSRVTVFPNRRLPLVANKTTEIEPIRDWIKSVSAKGFLKASACESFSRCLDTINTYVFVTNGKSRKRAYKFYPKLSSRRKAPQPLRPVFTNSMSSTPVAPTATALIVAESQQSPTIQCREEPEIETVNEIESNTTDVETNTEPVDEEIADIVELSHDDDAFIIMCLLFDSQLKQSVEVVAAPFLEKCRTQDVKLMPAIKDALIYAKWNRFGVKNAREHERRGNGLQSLRDLAAKVRDAYGLTPYSTLRLSFL